MIVRVLAQGRAQVAPGAERAVERVADVVKRGELEHEVDQARWHVERGECQAVVARVAAHEGELDRALAKLVAN